MSANNQILIKEHNGKFLVFDNVMAERWCACPDPMKCDDKCTPTLSAKGAIKTFDNRDDAYQWAVDHDMELQDEDGEGHEYGVQFNRLVKDDVEVVIVD